MRILCRWRLCTSISEQLYWLKGRHWISIRFSPILPRAQRPEISPFGLLRKNSRSLRKGWCRSSSPGMAKPNALSKELRYSVFPAAAARKAQRFTIQVYPQVLYGLLNAGSVERLHEQYNVLINRDLYREDLGLCPEDPTFHEIESLIT